MPSREAGTTLIEDLKRYVGFTEESAASLRALHPLAAPRFPAIADDFYAAALAHPGAARAITGGEEQVARLKATLERWLDTLLLGPHDEAYAESRARIGRVHVRIALPQQYMFTAMNRVRVRLAEVAEGRRGAGRATEAVHQILDIDLALMLDAYREDLTAKMRAAERLATIGQFATGIGHELRNPLATIDSSLFLLRQRLGGSAAADAVLGKHLDRIAGAVRGASNTIENLLGLARSRPPNRLRTSVAAIIDAAVSATLLPAGVGLEVHLAPGLDAEVDAGQIRQVLVNLFENASQAMEGRGRIVVDAERASEGLRLRVRDEGPGVPPELRGRIFEPLFTTKPTGIGLGLALCRHVLEAHGGSVALEDSAAGASFVVSIPDAATDPAAAAR